MTFSIGEYSRRGKCWRTRNNSFYATTYIHCTHTYIAHINSHRYIAHTHTLHTYILYTYTHTHTLHTYILHIYITHTYTHTLHILHTFTHIYYTYIHNTYIHTHTLHTYTIFDDVPFTRIPRPTNWSARPLVNATIAPFVAV